MAMFAAVKCETSRLTDLQRYIRGDLAVGSASDAVGAEISARHD
jgi:hypothetical protein